MSKFDKFGLTDSDWISVSTGFHFLSGSVLSRSVVVVISVAVSSEGLALYDAWSFARSGPSDRFHHLVVHVKYVLTIGDQSRNSVSLGSVGDVWGRNFHFYWRSVCPLVVFNNGDYGELVNSGVVDCFVENSLRR